MSRTEMHSSLSEAGHVSPIPKEAASDSQPTHFLVLENCYLSTFLSIIDMKAVDWKTRGHARSFHELSTPRMPVIPNQSSLDSSFVPSSLLFPTSITGKSQRSFTTSPSLLKESVAQSTKISTDSTGAPAFASAALASSSETASISPASQSSLATAALPATPSIPNTLNTRQRTQEPTTNTVKITTTKPTVTSPPTTSSTNSPPVSIITPPVTTFFSRTLSISSSLVPTTSTQSLTSAVVSTENSSLPAITHTSISPILSPIPTSPANISLTLSIFTSTVTLFPTPVSTTSSPIEATKITSTFTSTTPTLAPSSSTMSSLISSPGTAKDTSVLTTMSVPPSTSSVASDSFSSISVTTSLDTSTTSDTNILTPPSATNLPDTPTLSSSPPPTLTATSYETTSSTASEAIFTASSTTSMLPAANSSSVIATGTYSPTVTMVVSSPPITSQELPRVSDGIFTSSYLTTKYWSSTLFGGGMTTFSTIIETGVLSTNKPRDDNGFSHNTGAIIGVSLAGTFSLTMAVVIIFFACRKYKKRHTRYQGSNGEVRNFSRDSWYPPLEGDDDEYYPEDGRPVLTTYTPNMDHTDPEEGTGSAPEATNMKGTASPLMQGPGGQVVIGSIGFHGTQGPRTKGRSAVSVSNLALVKENPPHKGLPHTITSMSNTYPNTCSSKTHIGESHSALSLNTGSSTHENATASTSSRHRFPTKAIHDGISGVKTRPVSHISHSEKLVAGQESDESNFRRFLGHLRRDRDTVPTVIIHGTSATSLYEKPQTAPNTTPHFLGSPSSFSPEHGSGRTFSLPLNPTQPMELWPAATLPPSPTASEHSRTLEGLLTPHLEMWLASSERSSLASLRDNIDYSRPISGLVRNRVHSTMTFQTEDTAN